MPKQKKPELELSMHQNFFGTAINFFLKAHQLTKKAEKMDVENNDHIEPLSLLWEEIDEYWVIVIIFSALSAEAYINHYAIEHLSKNFFEKYLDKLTTVSKWIIVPKIVVGKQLDPGSLAIQHLDTLMKLRHKLVHYKTRYFDCVDEYIQNIPDYEEVELAIKTVPLLLLDLREIDSKIELDWFKESLDRLRLKVKIGI